MLKGKLVMCVVAAIILSFAVSTVGVAQDDFSLGFRDGRRDGESDAPMLKILWGTLFGPFALLYNWLTTPQVPGDRLLLISDKSQAYKEGYIEGYRDGYKNRSIMYNVAGWGIWILIVLL